MIKKLCFLLLFCCCTIVGQEFTVEKINIQDKTQELSNYYSYALDHDNNLWYTHYGALINDFGTEQIRHQLTPKETPFLKPSDLKLTSNGNLVALTEKGIYIFNPKTGEIKNIEFINYINEYDKLYIDKQDNIWVFTHVNDFILKIDQNYNQKKFKLPFVFELGTTVNFYTINNQLYITNKTAIYAITESCSCLELIDTLPNKNSKTLFFVKEAKFPENEGFYRYKNKRYTYKYNKELQGFLVSFFTRESINVMHNSLNLKKETISFFAAENKMLYAYYFKKNTLKKIKILPLNGEIKSLTIDANYALRFLDLEQLVTVKVVDQKINNIALDSRFLRTITMDAKQQIYASKGKGVSVFKKNNNVYKESAFLLASKVNIWSLHQKNKNNFLVLDAHGVLFLLNTQTKQVKEIKSIPLQLNLKKNLSSGYIIQPLGENKLLLGGEFGLALFDVQKNSVENVFINFNASAPRVTDIAIGNKQFWVATKKELFEFNLKTNGTYEYSNLSTTLKLSDTNILDLYKSDDYMYVGTINGLYVIDLKTKTIRKHYDDKEGLPDNRVAGILETKNDFWLGTYNGLVRLNKANDKMSIYKENDGLIGTDFNRKAFYKHSDTLLVFGTTKGLVYFNPNKIPRKENTNQIKLIAASYYNSQTEDISKIIYNLDSINAIEVPFNKNFISLTFGVQGQREKKVSYKLNNSAVEWLSTNEKNQVILNNLSPGKYTLQVRNQEVEGMQGKILTYNINVTKSVFYNNWFIGSLIITLLFAGIGFYYFAYIKRLKENNLKLETIKLQDKAYKAQMNPHFTFNIINNLKSFLLLKSENEVDKFIQSFAKLMRFTLNMSDREMVSLAEEIEYLQSYINLQISRKGLTVSVKIDTNDLATNKIFIPPMLFQPVVENAIEHGLSEKKDDKELIISFSINKDNLIGIVEDNGIGFKENNKKDTKSDYKSYGNEILKQRINIHNKTHESQISLHSENRASGGARIIITIYNIKTFINETAL